MKKLKNGQYFVNACHTEKFQITASPLVWVSGFLSVNGNKILALAIMKKLKNGLICATWKNLKLPTPNQKFGSVVYPASHLCVVLLRQTTNRLIYIGFIFKLIINRQLNIM